MERCGKRLVLEKSSECQARCLLKVGVGMPMPQSELGAAEVSSFGFPPSASIDRVWLGVSRAAVGSLSRKMLVLSGGVCVAV